MRLTVGDKVRIIDGSWSIKLSDEPYNTDGISGGDGIVGIIRAVECRLPLGPGIERSVLPIEGMPVDGTSEFGLNNMILFNDLLVQTEDGYVCTSTNGVKLVEAMQNKLSVFGIDIDITSEQKTYLARHGVPDELTVLDMQLKIRRNNDF